MGEFLPKAEIGKYLALVDEQTGYGVVVDHNGRSIVGVYQDEMSRLTPCFDAPMAVRLARLLNESPGDPIEFPPLNDNAAQDD